MSLYVKVKKLREQRYKLFQDMRSLHKSAKESRSGFNAEQRDRWDRMDDDVKQLTAEIEQIEADISVAERRAQQQNAGGARPDHSGLSIGEERKRKAKQAFRAWAAGGERALSAEQRTALQFGPINSPGSPFHGAAGLNLRTFVPKEELRAQAVGTNSLGGFTVAEDFANTLVESMLAFGGIRRAATILNTTTGADLPVPTADDTSNTGELLAENTQAADQDVSFGAVTLQSFMYSSKVVKVSMQLLQDSAFNIETFLAQALGKRLARITNSHFTTGTGSSQPNGIVTAASTGKTAASASALTADELLDLKHSVDPAYRGQAEEGPVPGGTDDIPRWMFNDSTLKAIKQLSIGSADARPLWQPSIAVGEPDRIDGDRFIVNQAMASIAASAKSVLYGDISQYWIRDVADVTLLRLSERYADYLQVGFLAFSRHDGDLIDAGTDPVKVLAHPTA